MATKEIKFKVRIKWWFLYLYLPVLKGLYAFTKLFINKDVEINKEKLKVITRRGITLEHDR